MFVQLVIPFVEKCSTTDLNTRGEWIGLIIEDRQNSKTIGDCALRVDQHMAEVGCNISPQYQKKGLANEVLTALQFATRYDGKRIF